MKTKTVSLSQCVGLLVAPDGRQLANGSPEFLALLGDPEPDYDAALFAVQNLGCIYSRSQGPLLEIVVHPRNVASPAVEAVIPLIEWSGATLFKIKYLSELAWYLEMPACARRTCARLRELCSSGEADRDNYGTLQGPATLYS